MACPQRRRYRLDPNQQHCLEARACRIVCKDGYVSFDNVQVGELQAETLAEKLKEDGSPRGPVIMINGDPADPNAAGFKEGAHNGFDAAGVKIAKEYDTPGWSAENAQREAQQAITALGNNGFAGIYAANDDTGGGAIAAMKGAGINPEEKPVTGQDATVAGLQRILAGQQYMTIYKEIKPEAEIAAEFAIALAEGEEVPQDKVTEELDNGAGKVPSVALKPVAVTKDNVKSTVIADGFVTAAGTVHERLQPRHAKKRASRADLRWPTALRSSSSTA